MAIGYELAEDPDDRYEVPEGTGLIFIFEPTDLAEHASFTPLRTSLVSNYNCASSMSRGSVPRSTFTNFTLGAQPPFCLSYRYMFVTACLTSINQMLTMLPLTAKVFPIRDVQGTPTVFGKWPSSEWLKGQPEQG